MKYYQSILVIVFILFNQTLNAAELDADIGWADVRQLAVPISGQVKEVMAAGSYVNAGETMLSFKCGVYQAQLKRYQSISSGLLPAVETALSEKELADELFERTVLSEVEHRSAELVYIKVKSQYNAAKAEVEEAKIKAGYCNLKAESALLVLNTHVVQGEMYTLESLKPALLTVASRTAMLATSKQLLPLEKMYKVGAAVKVKVAGKQYNGKIESIAFQDGNSVLIAATFDVFDPRLIANKTAKIIIQ